MRRASCASTFFSSIWVVLVMARWMASLVISWNSTRRTRSPPSCCRTCQAMASPSRSGSVAIRMRATSLAAFFSSWIAFALPLTVTNFGLKSSSTSTPSSRSGRSRMCPTVAFTV